MKAQKAKMKENEGPKDETKGNRGPKSQNERKWRPKRPKWKEMKAQKKEMKAQKAKMKRKKAKRQKTQIFLSTFSGPLRPSPALFRAFLRSFRPGGRRKFFRLRAGDGRRGPEKIQKIISTWPRPFRNSTAVAVELPPIVLVLAKICPSKILLGAAVFLKQKKAKREQNHKAQTKTGFAEYVLLIFNMFCYQNQNGKFNLQRRPVWTHKTAKSLSTKFLFSIDFCYLPSFEADDLVRNSAQGASRHSGD